MGSIWGCTPKSTQADDSPCPAQAFESFLLLPSSIAISRRQRPWQPSPISLVECLTPRHPAGHRRSRLVGLPGIGRTTPRPIAAWPCTPEGRQIEYGRSVPVRTQTPPRRDRLQASAALKEIGRSVYF